MLVSQHANKTTMNSSSLETLQSLARRIDRGEVERFLFELLNLRSEAPGAVRRFGEMFEDYTPWPLIMLPMRKSASHEECEAGVPEAVIQKLAGDVDPAMMRIYSHSRLAAKRVAVEHS
jgi:hypothetical protein